MISNDESQRALKNVALAMEPGGTIFLIDPGTLDDSRLSPTVTVRQNLWFINVFDQGEAKTEQERREWLAGSRFEGAEHVMYPDGRSMMVARKPGQELRNVDWRWVAKFHPSA